MAGVTFPNIIPTSRSYSPGTYPEAKFEAQNGAKTFIRYGNQRINAALSLSFSNITDADAVLILNNYKNSNEDWGTDTKYVEFDSSSETSPLAGASVDLKVYFKEGLPLRWRYTGPPQVQSVFPGRSNVSCSFVACLDAP